MTVPLRPRDFVETQDGVLAAVTSVVHAEGPVVTVRYAREPQGLRKLSAGEADALVATRHADWRARSTLLDLPVVIVPHRDIVRVHRPEARLAQLLQRDGSAIERRAAGAAADLLALGVPAERLGVTGSLLVGAATGGSDIDLVVYGRAAFARARGALETLVARARWGELPDAEWATAWRRRGAPGTLEDYVRHERRKRTKAMIEGTRLDLSLLQDPDEGMAEAPPFRKLGQRRLEATVLDAAAAFDLPARYRIDAPGIPEVVSYTATYAGQARAGERIEASGWLEEDALGRPRLLVGTSREAPGEWIRVVHAVESRES